MIWKLDLIMQDVYTRRGRGVLKSLLQEQCPQNFWTLSGEKVLLIVRSFKMIWFSNLGWTYTEFELPILQGYELPTPKCAKFLYSGAEGSYNGYSSGSISVLTDIHISVHFNIIYFVFIFWCLQSSWTTKSIPFKFHHASGPSMSTTIDKGKFWYLHTIRQPKMYRIYASQSYILCDRCFFSSFWVYRSEETSILTPQFASEVEFHWKHASYLYLPREIFCAICRFDLANLLVQHCKYHGSNSVQALLYLVRNKLIINIGKMHE